MLVFCVCSLSSARKQALLYLLCKVVALGSWHETESTSEGLKEENLMRARLLHLRAGLQEQTRDGPVSRTSSKGKPLPSPGQRDKSSKWWGAVRAVIMEEGPLDRSQHCEGTWLFSDTAVKQGDSRGNSTPSLAGAPH